MKTKIQKCRVCGCTEDDCTMCIITTGRPCFWVEKDLCSACAPAKEYSPEFAKRIIQCLEVAVGALARARSIGPSLQLLEIHYLQAQIDFQRGKLSAEKPKRKVVR